MYIIEGLLFSQEAKSLRGRNRLRHIIGVLFAIAAFLLVMACVPQTGAIYTHDSQSYEYAAASLLEYGEMRYFGYDTPIVQWPPFYITVAAFLGLFDIPLEQGAVWINAVCFAYLLYAMTVYLFDSLNVKWLAIPALIMMCASVPMVLISGYAWTEMLFIFLSMLSFILMLQYVKREKIGWLIATSILSALCWMTRYIGIVTIAVLALVLFLSAKPLLHKIRMTFLYILISCAPMAVWVLRNFLLSGTFTGGRSPGSYTLADNLWLSLQVFRNWSSFLTPLFTYIASVFLIVLVLITFFLEKEKKQTERNIQWDLPAAALYVILYAVALLASATGAAMDPINDRLWSPVYPYWILTLFFFIDRLIKNVKVNRLKHWIAAGFLVFALVSSISPSLWISSKGLARKHEFAGLKHDIGYRYSPVLSLVRKKIPRVKQTLVISNDAGLINMHTKLKCYYPPKKYSIPLYSFSRYKERMDEFRSIYLVWSGPMDSESFMTVSEFRRLYDLKKVAQNNYCTIYRVRKIRRPTTQETKDDQANAETDAAQTVD